MRKFFALMLITAALVYGAEEDKTLFGNGDINHGGFGAHISEFTSIDGEYAYVSGWKGAWVINRTFSVGFTSMNISTDVNSRDSLILDMGFSGLEFEYIYRSEDLLHIGGKLLLASGTMELEREDSEDERTVVADDHIFVMQPTVTGEVNIARWFRIGAGFGYRIVQDVEMPGFEAADLSGPSGHITLKFGWDM